MDWQQISKVLILLFVSVGIVTAVVLMGTGKYQDNTQIDKEIAYVFGFTLMIVIAIFFTNYLLVQSEPKMKLYSEWGLIYTSLILSYVSMSYIDMWAFGGSIADGAVTNVVNTGAGANSAGAQGSAPGSGSNCC
jgi:uncharacterized membrane protein